MRTQEQIRAYQESLPKKRMGAGAIFRDAEGRVLIVKPTYKEYWEIPGGSVEHNESPVSCCEREVHEELGLSRKVGKLLGIDYVVDDGVRTEGIMFVFDGGVLTDDDIRLIRLPENELSEFRFVAADEISAYMTLPLLGRRITKIALATTDVTLYLENGYEL